MEIFGLGYLNDMICFLLKLGKAILEIINEIKKKKIIHILHVNSTDPLISPCVAHLSLLVPSQKKIAVVTYIKGHTRSKTMLDTANPSKDNNGQRARRSEQVPLQQFPPTQRL